jgi:manganese oxidase
MSFSRLTRRQLLQAGILSAGIGWGGFAWWQQRAARGSVLVPPLPTHSPDINGIFNPMKILRDFDYGTVKQENGRTVREFRLTAQTSTIPLNTAVSFSSWNVNGRVPGPTLRANQGDLIRIYFKNEAGHAHSLHFHGYHPADMDGVKPIRHNTGTIYEFEAEPYGLHLYHCHIEPVTRHINKGLYGVAIVDPTQSRPPADEMVLVMAGYDTNDDNKNELYAFNGIPDYYMMHPIPIYQNQLVRLYVVNLIEFDVAATFHLHANMFDVYPTGMTLQPTTKTDVVTMGTAERNILEFSYKYTGEYMFHPHQDAIASAGCMGLFKVLPKP